MRVGFIDIIKGIAIIMIVNVHLISGQFFLIGCTYHVIAFFFTAGLVHGLSENWKSKSFFSFFKNKLLSLGYPYLALSICYILMHVVINSIRCELLINEVIEDAILKTISLQGIGTLWFLPVIFFGELYFYIVKKSNVKDTYTFILGLCAIFVASYMYSKSVWDYPVFSKYAVLSFILKTLTILFLYMLIAGSFINLGYFISKRYKEFLLRIDSINFRQTSLIIILGLCSFVLDYCLLKTYNSDIHNLHIGNPLIFLVCSLCGLTFVCSLSIFIEKCSKKLSRILQFFGKNSLIVMTTHTEYYINSIVFLLLTKTLLCIDVSTSNKVISGISLAIIMVIEVGVISLINRTFLRYIYKLYRNIN